MQEGVGGMFLVGYQLGGSYRKYVEREERGAFTGEGFYSEAQVTNYK